MAIGMVNSSQTLNPALKALRSGESLASTPAAIKDPKAKVYHHMHPGARFIMPDGLELHFLGGQFITADPDIIAELDKVADKVSSQIFTQNHAVDAAKELVKQVAADASDTAGTIKE